MIKELQQQRRRSKIRAWRRRTWCQRAGAGHAGRGKERRRRRFRGIRRHERRGKRGRNQRAVALRPRPAGGRAAGLDLPQMRTSRQHRQVLLKLRRTAARCWRLDLPQVRADRQYRQVLQQLRSGQAGSVQVPQMRLCSGGRRKTQVLPGVRRKILSETIVKQRKEPSLKKDGSFFLRNTVTPAR